MLCVTASAAGMRANAQETEIPSSPSSGTSSSGATEPVSRDGMGSLAPSPASTGAPADRVQYVGPDTYILRDVQGRPQAMPGMTYEDFLAAWKRLQQVDGAGRGARFVIDRVTITGHARERHAELQCKITVRLLTDEPVDVPLGMTEAILQGEARFTSAESDKPADDKAKARTHRAASDYLDYDPQGGGFVARFVGGSSEARTVSFTLLAPLSRDSAGNMLSLTCPRTVSSSLTLDVDAAVTDADVSNGVLTTQETTPDGTRLVVAGAIGPVRLTWQTPDARMGEFATVLNAQGAVRVAIDGRSVRTNARLTVQSYGGSFDRLRVKLPRGAQLIHDQSKQNADENAAYQISLAPRTPEAGPPDGDLRRQIVLVEFSEKQRGPVTIDLATEQPIGLEADSTVELSGMEVLGAVRRFGDVALQVAPDWQAHWDVGPHVRQVDSSEVDSLLQQPPVTAAFQYDREPWSLAVHVAARKNRVLVTPEYRLNCSQDEARLTARLSYQVVGARAFGFRVNLNGWELTADPVESGGLVDNDRIFVTPAGVLELPLAQALSRRAEITFTLKQPLEPGNQSIQLPLPVPIADSVSPGELVVRTAADIDLVPDLARSQGLMPRTNSDPPVAVTTDMVSDYNFRISSTVVVFAADRMLRSREVSYDVFTSVAFEETDVRVEQQIDFDVRHEPIQELHFEVPDELRLDAARPEILLVQNGDVNDSGNSSREVPLGVVPQSDGRQSSSANPLSTFHVALPQSRVGKFSVVIRYHVDKPTEPPSSRDWQLPLVQPLDGEMGSHRVACRPARRSTLSLDSSAETSTWTQISPLDASDSNSAVEFLATQPEARLRLKVQTLNIDTPAETFVDRVWLQTWISGDMRQDRAAFRFRTAGAQVAVELAPQTPDALELVMDGERARVLAREPGRVVVEVSQLQADMDATIGNEPATEHTLELRYRIPIRTALLTRHIMTPHQIVGSTALAESYWQVLLPADTHLIRSPRQMTAASVWQWLGSFWGRRPIRTQQNLEEWSGATVHSGLPQSQNEYLFTGLAPVSTMEFVTAPRWLIVLVASASALGLALGYIHVPAMWRPWMLGALACLVAGLALAFPTAALLLAQASVLGLVLAVLAILIARLVTRPSPWGVVIPASGTHRETAPPRLESIVMPPVVATASTSPTVPLRVPESE
jgi:hypothetical protein